MKIVKLSSKRQITIPKDLLVNLELQPRSQFIIQVQDETLVMKPLKSSVVTLTAGSLTSYVSPKKLKVSFPQIIKEAKKATVRQLAANL